MCVRVSESASVCQFNAVCVNVGMCVRVNEEVNVGMCVRVIGVCGQRRYVCASE